MADGQQVLNATSHVSNPLPTRQVTLRFEWNDSNPKDYYSPLVIATAGEGTIPSAFESSTDTYRLNLLLGARYTIRAVAHCRVGTSGEADTGIETVDGGDSSVTQVTLTFGKGACSRGLGQK